MAINKVIYGGETLIDLTADTVTKDKVLSGYTFHGKDGVIDTGICTFDSDTTDATAIVSEILSGKTVYARGTKLTGDMPNNGSVTGSITTKTQQYTIPIGYHDGSGKVGISTSEQAKLVEGNIKQGITILGVTGTYSGAAIKSESKTVTPTKDGFTVQPSAGNDYLSSVVVNPIPYIESENSFGTTVTIG